MAFSKFCAKEVVLMYRRDGTEVKGECGTWFGGTQVFCGSCETMISRQYPQGYVGYPGDVCRHGKYVGGCGADIMCGACEMGV